MKQFLCLSAAAGLMAVSMASCIDDKYDLSKDGLDKTSEFKLVDLTLPVNVSEVKLDQIIKLEENSSLKVVEMNGKEVYAVVQSGDFESQSLKIQDIQTSTPQIAPTYVEFDVVTVEGQHDFQLRDVPPQPLTYTADNVDDYITGLTGIYMEKEPSVLTMEVDLEGATDIEYELSKLRILMPKGLQVNPVAGYDYNPGSGVLTIDKVGVKNGKGAISLEITGMELTDEARFENHKLIYESSITFKEATLSVKSGSTSLVPQLVRFGINSTLTALHITSFSGDVHYDLTGEGLDIPAVSLGDLPDFLSQGNTTLRLANPQLYVGVESNPVAEYGLNFSTGMRLTKIYGQSATGSYEPERRIETSTDKYGAGPYDFVLSPTDPKSYPDQFAKNIEHIPFPGMSDVLDGAGLPDRIEIELLTPEIPTHHVDHFKLQEYSALKGHYEFLAPLAFKPEGTVIIYSDTFDDWGSDDLDKLTLNAITVDADALSTLPLDAKLHITPLADEISDLKVSDVILKASPDTQHITLSVTGTIRNFKGITIEAVVNPANENVIAPDQTITLTNLKAKVSGSYITDFDDSSDE